MSSGVENTPNPDIEAAYRWLLSYIPSSEWAARRTAIEQHLEAILDPNALPAPSVGYHRLIGPRDQIGWYLYLAETSLYEPRRTEVNQAARVLPILLRLGSELSQLRRIGGIDEKAVDLLSGSKSQPDSVLFEMLIALLWARNGWPDVSFIPPDPNERRPDIRAGRGSEKWFVETKRMAAKSDYSQKERDKWLRIWKRLKDALLEAGLPLILDITFHVELETFDDDFARDQLAGKLKRVVGPCELISNDRWTVCVRFVDFDRIRRHFEKFYVKSHSRQLQELVDGRWERGEGFTMVLDAPTVRIGEGQGVNHYVERINWAAGAYWHCDAERAYENKARDIRGQLANAVDQLPATGRGTIHVGIETQDGELVEAERFKRILKTAAAFNPNRKDLRWVYCHLYEAYAPPDKAWCFDETVYPLGLNREPNPEPITLTASVVPNEEDRQEGTHWLREAP
ncbi:MAG: hypothetical protein ACOC7K_01000 [bacterium]